MNIGDTVHLTGFRKKRVSDTKNAPTTIGLDSTPSGVNLVAAKSVRKKLKEIYNRRSDEIKHGPPVKLYLW